MISAVASPTYDYKAFTFEAWVAVPNGGASSSFVLWRGREASASASAEGIEIGYINERFYVKDLSVTGSENIITSVETTVFSAGAVGDARWHHVAVTRNGGNGQTLLIVNGYTVGTGTLDNLLTKPIGSGRIDGYVLTAASNDVEVDELRLFTEERTLIQIRQQMSIALPNAEIQDNTLHTTFNDRAVDANHVDSSGRLTGAWSSVLTYSTAVPSEAVLLSPGIITAVTGGAGVITWENRDDIGGQDVIGYELYRSTRNGADCTMRAQFEEYDGLSKKYSLTPLPESTDVIPTVRSVRIVRLQPSSTYKVCVGAKNGFTPRQLTPAATLITLSATVPGMPPSPERNVNV